MNMEIVVTEGEAELLEKIRRTKERMQEESTIGDKLELLNRRATEIIRYVIYEILREEKW